MLKIYKSKFEYEVLELAKGDKTLNNFCLKTEDIDLSPLVLDLAESKSLFADAKVYLIKCDKAETLDFLNLNLLEACEASADLFLFWGKSAEFAKVITNLGYKVIEKKEAAQDFFPKELVSAIQNIDKRKTWICLLDQLSTKSAEEVYGVCNWALKQMIIVSNMQYFDEKSSLKDFQYRNIKKGLSGKDKQYLDKIYFDFVNTYNASREKSIDLGKALEAWVLGW